MDTNVKNYKYSLWTKVICIVISLSLFSVSAGLLTSSVMSYFYWRSSDMTDTWYHTEVFTNEFKSDVGLILENSISSKEYDDLSDFLNSEKENAVSDIYDQYLKYEKEYGSPQYDEYGNLESDDKTFYYKLENKKLNCLTEFSVNFIEIYNSENDAKSEISDRYDNFANMTESEMIGDYESESWMLTRSEERFNDSLIYAAVCGSESSDFINNLSSVPWGENHGEYEKHFSENEIYFMWTNDNVKYGGITNKQADDIYKTLIESNEYAKGIDLYVAISMPEDTKDVIGNIRFWNDKYINMAEFNDYSKTFEKHSGLFVGIEVLFLAISAVIGFSVLFSAGKRSDGKEVRLVFVDKIPFEIHFALSGGLIFGIAAFFVSLLNIVTFDYSPMNSLLASVLLCLCWLVLFEFSYSIARFVNSKKDIKSGFLCYKIFRQLRKAYFSLSSALRYKPQKFSRNVILIAVIYILGNLVCIGIIGLAMASDANLFALLLVFADIGVNIYLFVRFLKYIQQLDKIILASVERSNIDLDFEKLPKSLRLLAESMKYTNNELQNAVAKAVKDEKLRTELITNVSHDLKTPLTSIITYVDLLSKCGIEDEKAREYIRVLDDKGAKLKRLIDDLIEASKVTSGNITVNLTPISLSELCLQSTVDAQQDFEKAGLNLVVKGSEKPPIVIADGAKTFRIIENLLSNARKYSAVGSRVYVNVYSEGKYGVFEIKNISAQQLDISPDELTERFVRGDKSRNREGNGLGLSIAKELCRLQNGQLRLTIDGDLFKAKVMLPLASADSEKSVSKTIN